MSNWCEELGIKLRIKNNHMNILFVCGRNKRRSVTAEALFANSQDIIARSAGTSNEADNVVNLDDIQWADKIFCMEESQKVNLVKKFNMDLKNKSVYVLNIPDKYEYMDEKLITLLKSKLKNFNIAI